MFTSKKSDCDPESHQSVPQTGNRAEAADAGRRKIQEVQAQKRTDVIREKALKLALQNRPGAAENVIVRQAAEFEKFLLDDSSHPEPEAAEQEHTRSTWERLLVGEVVDGVKVGLPAANEIDAVSSLEGPVRVVARSNGDVSLWVFGAPEYRLSQALAHALANALSDLLLFQGQRKKSGD